jgi:hypothetical protein
MIILNNISEIIKTNIISTRKNRGKIIEILNPVLREIIDINQNNIPEEIHIKFEEGVEIKKLTKTRRSSRKNTEIFGGNLYLEFGETNDLYRDIEFLYLFYQKNKNKLSDSFLCLIRMSIRLLVETAAKSRKQEMKTYITANFAAAKNTLDQDMKTSLSAQNVLQTNIVQLLHIGAHNYTESKNMEQTMAISIIIGAILQQTHGKQ